MFSNLLCSAFLVSFFTLLSRIMGMVRDIVFAFFLGGGVFADIFFVAFRIPNLFRRIFGEGAFNSAFVPVLSEEIERGDDKSVQQFIDFTSGVLLFGLIITVAIGILAAKWVIYIVAPGFGDDPQKLQLAAESLRWTFPYLLCISLVAMAAGILNSYNRFAVPAFTPVLLNLVLIGTAIGFLPLYEQKSVVLAIGVCVAGLVQLLFQIPFLRKIQRLPKPRIRGWRKNSGVVKALKLMGPSIIGASAGQINLVINTILASFLATGSVSWLYYSDRLMEFPVGMLAIAIGTVILPTLSRSYADKDDKKYSDVLDWGLRLAVLLCLPAAIALAILAYPLMITLFTYGAFSVNDAIMASYSLIAFAFAVPAVVLIKVVAPAYFARQDTKSPVRFAMISMAINVVAGIVLSPIYGHIGLALALMVSSNVNLALLLYFALKRRLYRPRNGWLKFLLTVSASAFVMAIIIYFVRSDPQLWSDWTLLQRVSRLCLILISAILGYFATLYVCGVRVKSFLTYE